MKRHKQYQQDNSFYWSYKLAEIIVYIRGAKARRKMRSSAITAIMYIKKFLHDGIQIDDTIFRIEFKQFGEPDIPLKFETPVKKVMNQIVKIRYWIKNVKV